MDQPNQPFQHQKILQPQTPQKPKLAKWMLFLIIILSITNIGCIGFGAYQYLIREQIESSDLSTSQEKTFTKNKNNSLKTYKSNELSITFSYPSSWEVPQYENGSLFLKNIFEDYYDDFGYITITSKNDFRDSFKNCLKKFDSGTCEYIHRNMTYEEFLEQLEIIKSLMNENISNNRTASNHSGFKIGCDAPGDHIALKTIYNSNLEMNIPRTIGYCSYDTSLSGYFYYASFVVGDEIIKTK